MQIVAQAQAITREANLAAGVSSESTTGSENCLERDKLRAREDEEETAFEDGLRKKRAGQVPIKLPREARKYGVQANFAVEDKRFADAVDRYADALKVSPWWPQGYYNRALILGKIRCLSEAMRDMKRYLQLAPQAADAEQAQDKIDAWESAPR